MRKTFFLLALSVLYFLNSKAQSIPKYLSPDGLVTYLPLDSKEISNSTGGKYLGNAEIVYKRYDQNIQNIDEQIIFMLTQIANYQGNKYLGPEMSIDRSSNERLAFLSELKISNKKMDFQKPISIGFWASTNYGSKSIKLEYILQDSIELVVELNKADDTHDYISIQVEQISDNKYQKFYFVSDKFKRNSLNYTSSTPISYKQVWDFLVIEFDVNSISISINGDALKTYSLDFLSKRDFKKENPNTDVKRFIETYHTGNYDKTIIKSNGNIDDVFVYDRKISNQEIAAITFSKLNPFYNQGIRNAIRVINNSFENLQNTNEFNNLLNFLNNDFHEFGKYVTEFSSMVFNQYPRIAYKNVDFYKNPTLDSLNLTYSILETAINSKVESLFAPLISNPTKEVILNTFNQYAQIDKKNVETQFLNRFKDAFAKLVRQNFYNTLEKKDAITESSFFKTQSALLTETKELYKRVTDREFDLEYNLINHPPKSGLIRYKSSTKDFVKNATVILDEFNKDRKVLTDETKYTVKWDEKELNFLDFKLSGNQKFYDSGSLVYEYELKGDKLYSETWNYFTTDDVHNLMNVYDADHYYKWGEIMFNEKLYTRALHAFDVAIKLDSRNDQYYYYRSITRGTLNMYSAAMEDIDKAISLNAKPEYYWARGIIIYNKDGAYNAFNDLTQAKSMGYNDKDNVLERVRKERDQIEREYEVERKKRELAEAEKNKEANEIAKMLNDAVKSMVAGATGEWQKNPKACHYCKGKGIVSVCPLCDKRGKILCKKCKGKKVLYDGTVCIQCYGTGIQKCDGCNGKIYNIKCQHTIWQFQR